MKTQKSTIKDVAALASVSIKTVSRVVNDEEKVGEKTREKVLDAIKKLNYQPNLAARNLATTKSHSLGYVYDNPNAYYILDMQNGILEACRKKGYELVIHPCDSSKDGIVEELSNTVLRSQLAGLIISPPLSENAYILKSLEQKGIAFIRVISKGGEDISSSPYVAIDDRQAACEIISHLIACGHNKIAIIKGDKAHQSTQQRLLGYLDALAQNNIEVRSDYIINGEYTFDCGVKGIEILNSLSERPSAVFACNDEIAAGAIFSARLNGISVPVQLAIAGFENSPFSRQTLPKITTAAQDVVEIGRQAATNLINYIDPKLTTSLTATTVYTPKLLIRGSTNTAESNYE